MDAPVNEFKKAAWESWVRDLSVLRIMVFATKQVFHMIDLFEFIADVFSLSNEALPRAPAPAEVAHPAPDQNEHAALLRDIHTLIRELLREYCAKGRKGGCPRTLRK
ncbi:unnamed protein product [Malus baccata var. baccata]